VCHTAVIAYQLRNKLCGTQQLLLSQLASRDLRIYRTTVVCQRQPILSEQGLVVGRPTAPIALPSGKKLGTQSIRSWVGPREGKGNSH
jgi:hypothetical protein